MGFFSWLTDRRGENRNRGDRQQEAARKLSPAMPMAGAGAELAGESNASETEENLKRAAKNDRASSG